MIGECEVEEGLRGWVGDVKVGDSHYDYCCYYDYEWGGILLWVWIFRVRSI